MLLATIKTGALLLTILIDHNLLLVYCSYLTDKEFVVCYGNLSFVTVLGNIYFSLQKSIVMPTLT